MIDLMGDCRKFLWKKTVFAASLCPLELSATHALDTLKKYNQ
jgi:hypothetical protein